MPQLSWKRFLWQAAAASGAPGTSPELSAEGGAEGGGDQAKEAVAAVSAAAVAGLAAAKELLFWLLRKVKDRFAGSVRAGRGRADRDPCPGHSAFLQQLGADAGAVAGLAEWPLAGLALRVVWRTAYEVATGEAHGTVHRQLAADVLCAAAKRVVELAAAAEAAAGGTRAAVEEALPGLREQQRQVCGPGCRGGRGGAG